MKYIENNPAEIANGGDFMDEDVKRLFDRVSRILSEFYVLAEETCKDEKQKNNLESLLHEIDRLNETIYRS